MMQRKNLSDKRKEFPELTKKLGDLLFNFINENNLTENDYFLLTYNIFHNTLYFGLEDKDEFLLNTAEYAIQFLKGMKKKEAMEIK